MQAAVPPVARMDDSALLEKLSHMNKVHAEHQGAFGHTCHICIVNATNDVKRMSPTEAEARAFLASHSQVAYVRIINEFNQVMVQIEPSLCVQALQGEIPA